MSLPLFTQGIQGWIRTHEVTSGESWKITKERKAEVSNIVENLIGEKGLGKYLVIGMYHKMMKQSLPEVGVQDL